MSLQEADLIYFLRYPIYGRLPHIGTSGVVSEVRAAMRRDENDAEPVGAQRVARARGGRLTSLAKASGQHKELFQCDA